MIESKLYDQGEISIHGQVSYQDSIISTVYPVMVTVGDSYLTIEGEGSLKDKTINILADMERAADHLASFGLADGRRVFIQGRSSGGYTALMAMIRAD